MRRPFEVGIVEPKRERVKIGQLLDGLVADLKARDKDSTKTISVVELLRVEVGHIYADELTSDAVRKYGMQLRSGSKGKGRRSKSLANATIRRRLVTLAQAYKLANIARAEAKQELLIVPQSPKLALPGARSGFLERARFEAFRAALPGFLRDLVTFAYLTGWRRKAVCSLECPTSVTGLCTCAG